jgi:hypothetical protein
MEDRMNSERLPALALAGVLLVSASGASWAQPPCITSDSEGNTACGSFTLKRNTTGNGNTAAGSQALFINTTGALNTAAGFAALRSNTTGSENTAAGNSALFLNKTGRGNTAAGSEALVWNATGDNNTAAGFDALYTNVTGFENTAAGFAALMRNSSGGGNTAIGASAGEQNDIGSNNTFIGANADANAGHYVNGTAIGYNAKLTASNTIVLGNRAITRIYAQVTSLTAISDRRQKKDIAPLDAELGLPFIQKLRPVSYRFNNGDETLRYGFVAQELEQALPARLRDRVQKAKPEHGLALIERQNDKARTYRLAYGEMTASLVSAIQEQQREIAGLKAAAASEKAENAALRQALATLSRRVDAMTGVQTAAKD